MKFPAHADKKSFKIFAGTSLGAFAALAIPLIFGDKSPSTGEKPDKVAAQTTPLESSIPSEEAPPEKAPRDKAPPKKDDTPAPLPPPPPPPQAAVFTVADYDPSRDPRADLTAAVERAKTKNKRILLVVGGAWCTWSRALDVYILENEEAASALARDFLIMKVSYGQSDENRVFVQGYSDIEAIPHFFILDSEGEMIHSQPTAPLEKGLAYDTEVFLAFLAKWAPPKAVATE